MKQIRNMKNKKIWDIVPSLIIVICQITTLVLKLSGVLTCSWFSVFLPIILPAIVIVSAVVGVGVVILVDYFRVSR